MTTQWPFVGREDELSAVAQVLEDPAGSRGMVIAGPAGVGKTRLAVELARRRLTVQIVATRATRHLPLGAFAPVLSSQPPSGSLATMLGRAADAICARAPDDELTLLVDDAHLLDDISAALVFQLAQQNRARLLVTYRTGESAPEPVRLLWERELLDWLELPPLEERETEHVLTVALGGRISASAVARFTQACAGNMLLLRELVNACQQSGALELVDDVWVLRGPWPMAPRLVELVTARLGTVTDEEQRLLELLAYGEPMSLAMFDLLADPDLTRGLEQRGLIVAGEESAGVRVRLAHPLYAEVLQARCPTLRARERHRELAGALAQLGADRADDVLRLAVWRLDAGIDTDAATLVTAGRRAWAAHDLVLAERLARAAVAADGGFASAQLLAELLSSTDRSAEAEDVWMATETLPLTEEERAKHTGLRVWNLLLTMDRAAEGLAVLDRNRARLENPYWRAELDATAALCMIRLGQLADGMRLAEEVVTASHPNAHARVLGSVAAGLAAAAAGHYDRAAAAVGTTQGLAGKIAEDSPWLVPQVDRLACLTALHAGDLDTAERVARRRLAIMRDKSTWDEEVASWTATVAWVLRFRGLVRDAVLLLKEADAIRHDPATPLTLATAELAHAAALTGQAVLAEQALARASHDRPAERLTRFWVAFARPWVAWVSGSHPEPAMLAIGDAADAAVIGAHGYEAILLHDAVRFGAAADVADRLTELVDKTSGKLVPLYAAHARAVVARNGVALATLSSRFAEVGAMVLAAEAAVEAAEAFDRTGDRAAATAVAEARRLAALCQDARTPVLARLHARPEAELTARERQIAVLAAADRTSKEIAEQLTTSVRTVDNHLYRIYAKLGINSRAALRAVLDPGQGPE